MSANDEKRSFLCVSFLLAGLSRKRKRAPPHSPSTMLPRLMLEEALDANKALTNEVTQQKVKAEFELERTRIDLQDTKVQYEKQYGDYARDRDAEVMSLRKGMDTSDKSFEAQRENLNSQIRKLETQRRQHERTIADMQKVRLTRRKVPPVTQEWKTTNAQVFAQDLTRLEQERGELEEASSRQAAKIKQLEDGYSARLMEILAEDDAGGHSGTTPVHTELVEHLQVQVKDRDVSLAEAKQQSHDQTRYIRKLEEAYKEARNNLEDMGGKKVKSLAELGRRMGKLSDLETQLKQDLETLQTKHEGTSRELETARAKLISNTENHRRQQLETKEELKALTQETVTLRNEKKHLERQIEALGKGRGNSVDTETIKELRTMLLKQQQQLSRMEEQGVKTQPGSYPMQSPAGAFGDGAADEALRAENARLQRELRAAKALAGKASGGRGVGGADSATVLQLQKENAELLTRVTVAEKQRASYESFMKATMTKNKAAISELKKELAFWKKQAMGKGVSGSAYQG